MSTPAIDVTALSKLYTIGTSGSSRQSNATLRDRLTSAFSFKGNDSKSGSSTKEFWALRNVNLTIEPGTVLGLVGSNGAGKSTLLKVLSRVTAPTSGRIQYSGKIASLLEVGTGFHPELTGRENIMLYGAILGMSRQDIASNFDAIVAFSEIESFIDTPVKRYSSGMYMRLAFAVAAHLRSDILLVDEVLAVGDARFQAKCLGKMKDVTTGEGRTVIFVSHNLQSVQSLCTAAAYLDRGQLVMHGDVNSVISTYIARSGGNTGSKVWDEDEAPGNEELRLREVSIVSENGGTLFGSASNIYVDIAFDAKRIPESACIGFDLVTASGVDVLRTYQTDMAEEQQPAIRIGPNRWRCRLPGSWFNAGQYFVCPKLSIHNQYWIVNAGPTVGFEVMLNHGESPYWSSPRRRPGVAALILDWSPTQNNNTTIS